VPVQSDVGTIKIRNDRNQQLFRNAGLVEELGLDPSELLYPGRTTASKDEAGFVCGLEPVADADSNLVVVGSFDVEMQFSVDPDGFTRGYGGPNTVATTFPTSRRKSPTFVGVSGAFTSQGRYFCS
jgi:hypothetical protein